MAKRANLTGTSGIGWIASCAAVEDSAWGEVESFYEDVRKEGKLRSGRIIFEAQVFGKMTRPAGLLPECGDGFAIYHSTRAIFPAEDRFQKRPRISAVGELLAAAVDDEGCLCWVRIGFDPRLLELMKERPIIRNDGTRPVLEACGIRSGAPASYYRADKAAWRQVLALLPSGPPDVNTHVERKRGNQ